MSQTQSDELLYKDYWRCYIVTAVKKSTTVLKSESLRDAAYKLTRETAVWAITLGVFSVLSSPLLEAIVYTEKNTKTYAGSSLFVKSLILGFIVGGILIAFGIRLRRYKRETISEADKTLMTFAIVMFVIVVFSLFVAGGVSVIGIILIVECRRARNRISLLELNAVRQKPH
jgi:hypothetical protein